MSKTTTFTLWNASIFFSFFCNVVSNTSSLQTSTSEGCWPQWPQFITIGIWQNKRRNHFFCLVFKDWNDLTKVCNSFSKLVLVLFLQREWESRLQHLFYKGRSIWNIWHERGKKTKKFYPPTTLQLIWKMKLKVQAEAADADVTNVADDEDAPAGEDLLLTLIRHHLWQSTPLLSQLFFFLVGNFSL